MVKPLRLLAESLAPAIDLVYPPRCPLCGDAIEAQSGLCLECWKGLVVPGEPACATCQRPLGALENGEGTMCAPCLASPPKHGGIAAATLYNDTSRQLVLRYKHGRRIALAKLMAALMAPKIPQVEGSPLLVPVPLHRWRLWQRGFNQAALLADELGKLGAGEPMKDALVRKKRTPALGGLGRKARERALSGAIVVRPSAGKAIAGRPVILVDDVLTSGATSDACVRALLKAGAGNVTIACFSRVLDEALPDLGLSLENAIPPETKTPEATRTSGAT